MKTLKDRVAVVTGASSGIGRATAVALAKEGCDLAISDVNEAGLAETAELVRATGRRACTHRVDVSDKARMQRYAEEVFAEYGKVHVVVNNAGVTVTAPFDEHSLEDFEWIVGINFWGVVYGCKFFLPYLKQQDEAHIVNLSSVFGLVGVPLQTSYCATKFAVRGFSEALWVELKPHGIGVTSIHPGGVRTNIAKTARTTHEDLRQQGVDLLDRVSITPEKCAAQIVSAIKKNKQRKLVTRETVFVDGLKRLSPTLAQVMLARGYERGLVGGIKPAGK
jgi:NAD(P)-dependent dehydrogenase (short-subunit alcohol dehydrogenase family)